MALDPPTPFPTPDQVRKCLLDQVQDIDGFRNLRMVVSCVVPPPSDDIGGSPRFWVYPVDLDAENESKTTLTQHTPFLLGSTTKTLTATAYTLLFRNMIGIDPNGNKIDINESNLIDVFTDMPGLKGLNFSPNFGETVTYTSGLIDTYAPDDLRNYQYEQFMEDLRKVGPGAIFSSDITSSAYLYSDLGFALLGMLMQEGEYGNLNSEIGTDLPSVMRSTIFDPLQMQKTAFFSTMIDKSHIPAGYQINLMAGAFLPATVGNSRFPAYDGGGGIVTNGRDFARWLAFSMGLVDGATAAWDTTKTDLNTCLETVLTPSWSTPTQPIVNSTDPVNYPCSGWFATCVENTPTHYFKDGALQGASSYLLFTPTETGRAGVGVLLNCGEACTTHSGVNLPEHVAYRVLHLLQNPSSAGT